MIAAVEQRQSPNPNYSVITDAEAIAKRAWENLDNKNYSPFFDIRKSRDFYHLLIKNHGIDTARQIALPVLQNDLYTQAWEAIDGKKPCQFGYQIIYVDGERRLVHESDLHSRKDIATGLDPSIRRGSERIGILNFRQQVLDSKVGETVVQASPMKHKKKETNKDCYYPDTFFTIARKVSESQIMVRQFKSRFISPEQAREVVNRLVKRLAIKDPHDLDSVIETAATFDGQIGDDEVIKVMEQVSGVKIEDGPDLEEIKSRTLFAGKMLMHAFEEGYDTEKLRQIHVNLLAKVIGVEKGVRSSKIFVGPNGQIRIALNCGSVSTSGASFRRGYGSSSFMGGEEGEKGWHMGKCAKCGDEKEIGGCDICHDCEKFVA